MRGLKILDFGEDLRSAEECGCGFRHERTLKNILIGPIGEALEVLEDLGFEPPFAVFYDPLTRNIAGRLVEERLGARGVLIESPTFREAEEKLGEAGGAKTILGVGGGTVIDAAKYAAYRLRSDFIAIPTAPSHDGMVSPIVSLFLEGRRKSILARSPRAAIIDLSILRSAPRDLIASGYGDILAKIVSIKDWQLGRDELGEPYCETAEKLILGSLNELIDCLVDKRSPLGCLEPLVRALVNSGAAMMLVESSRPASGSEHLISHYLDMALGRRLRHGIQCALGTLAMAAYHKLKNPNWWRGGRYDPEAIRSYVSMAGAPSDLREAGIPIEVMRRAIARAWRIRPKRYTILHKFKPDEEDAAEILKHAKLV